MYLSGSVIKHQPVAPARIKLPDTQVEISLCLLGLRNIHRALLAMDSAKPGNSRDSAKNFASLGLIKHMV